MQTTGGGSAPVKKKKPALGRLVKEMKSLPAPPKAIMKAAKPGSAKKRSAVKTAKVVRQAVKSGTLSKRAATVIKRGSREINRGPAGGSVSRFTRSAVRDITKKTHKGYTQALVKSAATSATKAEAKGVRKVLKRQPPSPRTRPGPGRQALARKRG